MTWTCPICNEENGDYNAWCEFCKEINDIYVYNPDKYFVRDIRLYHLSRQEKPMTPQEELFAKFFKKHTDIMLVKDMTLLQIQQYMESYSEVALEAKAAVYAANQLAGDKKKKNKKEAGFESEPNKTQTDAINVIKQKKLSRKELIEKQLKELYAKQEEVTGQKIGEGAAKEAAKVVSARNMLTVVENKVKNESRFSFAKKTTAADDAVKAILTGESSKLLDKELKPIEPKPTKPFSSWRKG